MRNFTKVESIFTYFITRAGPLLGAERAGPGVFEHPPV